MNSNNRFKVVTVITLALVLAACGVTPSSSSVTPFSSSSISSINFIPITNSQELSNIRNNLSGNYRLMNDIDLESVEWQPIGSGSTPFSGTLDGKEFTISNLTITQTQEYVGLFSNNSGSIRNLKLENVQISVVGPINSNISAGSLVAENEGIIENIETIDGSLFVRARKINYGYVGGIIGYDNSSVSIHNLINNIDVSGENITRMGGLIGSYNGSSITNSMNSGGVSGGSEVGGLIGSGGYDITIQSSINNGSVNGSEKVGGLIGYGHETTIANSMNSGGVSGGSEVGGLIGSEYHSITITNSMNKGSVNGIKNVGGLIGFGHSRITTAVNNGDVNGTDNFTSISESINVGGLIGYGLNTDITSSVNNGNVSGISRVGGLIGSGEYADITSSINSGSVDGSIQSVGGLIGYGTSNTITNSINSGTLNGGLYIGGLIGIGYFINIMTSMNMGNLSGSSDVGGLIGISQKTLFIYYSVNLGNVEATLTTTEVGGIYGERRLPDTNDFEDVYHYGNISGEGLEVSGTDFGSKITNLTTFNLYFFTTTLGWDTQVWDFTGLDIANGVYPTLKNMPVVE